MQLNHVYVPDLALCCFTCSEYIRKKLRDAKSKVKLAVAQRRMEVADPNELAARLELEERMRCV